jgi:hypothetical protein
LVLRSRPGRDLHNSCIETLGYVSFFTVGEDEVRAWSIRAECFTYNELIEYRSEKGVRGNGHFRLEGKDYIVRDGDILSIRFSV